MGNNYLPVLWNKQKKRYDKLLLLGIALLAFSLVGLQFLIDGNITPETLIIRTSAIVASLHLAAGFREKDWLKNQEGRLKEEGFYQVCPIVEIPDDCAKGVFIDGQNIAIFKYDNKVSAVNNVCRHQMGPLSEGKIVDGCITCPWHGYQYLPESGQAPPPFTEKLETYNVKILDGEVWVNPTPHPEGTFLEPATLKA